MRNRNLIRLGAVFSILLFTLGCATLGFDEAPSDLKAYEADANAISTMEVAAEVLTNLQLAGTTIPPAARLSLSSSIVALDATRTAMRNIIDACLAQGQTIESCDKEVYVMESVKALAAQTSSVMKLVETF